MGIFSQEAGFHSGHALQEIKAARIARTPIFFVLSSSPKPVQTRNSYPFSNMGSITPSLSFNVLRDTKPDDTTLPAFMVSTTRGFLPRQEPIIELPSEFDALESILSRMPIKTLEGMPGLLATFTLGETVLKELPDLTTAIDKYKDNLPLMNALYRDYSFLASAYLLEPCHERFVRGESYGLGRQTLPSVISLPISRCAEL
jgi:indoleamine 2,3-dioxygenase